MCYTEDTTSTLIEEMRASRESSNVAFIKFVDNYSRFSTSVFCFYEGEDGKYYNQKIKTILGDNVITIKVGNKESVLKTWRKIKSDSHYDEVNKCFFVDRDMDNPPPDRNDDLYITPCYSIENLYVTQNAFSNILQSEFSCDQYDSDYKKCIDKFIDLYGQFNNHMIEFNALVLLRNKKCLGNEKIPLNGINTSKLVSVTIDGVLRKNTYCDIINNLKTQLNVNEEELNQAINQIKTHGDYGNVFRGKNQIFFLASLIKLLKELHREKTFFDNKHTSVTISITDNILSELSQYAEFPECLKLFLKKHKILAS